ncbi:MAG: hypothetical protein NF693_09010 [Bombella sp.]|nr:hypothetical protein [Bombella sp.]
MAIILEDGSQVTNANGYVSLVEIRDFASMRGIVLSATDSIVETFSFKATDFFETYANRFKGSKVSATQALQFPREGVSLDGFSLASNEVPSLVKKCICQLVIELHNGIDIAPTTDGKFLIREKIDVIENEWQPGSSSGQPNLTLFEAFIAPLLQTSTGGLTVRRA